MNPLNIVITIVVIVVILVILYYIFYDPNTLQGQQSGKKMSRIEASSMQTDGSNSAPINYTYSIWFYVADWNYKYGKPKVIFGRMGAKTKKSSSNNKGASSHDTSSHDIGGKNPSPAVVLGAVENNLAISVSCYPGQDSQPSTPGEKTVVHTCNISNIPIQRWVNLLITTYGRTLDVYLNGKLTRTCLLPGIVASSKNTPIFVTPAGGFDGTTSRFQYWPQPFNPQQAWNIYTRGPGAGGLGLSNYEVKVAVFENGSEQNSYTIGGS